jgi:hypothetical protein
MNHFFVIQAIDGEWSPAPAYDVPRSQPYGDTTMALSLGGGIGGVTSAPPTSLRWAQSSTARAGHPTSNQRHRGTSRSMDPRPR